MASKQTSIFQLSAEELNHFWLVTESNNSSMSGSLSDYVMRFCVVFVIIGSSNACHQGIQLKNQLGFPDLRTWSACCPTCVHKVHTQRYVTIMFNTAAQTTKAGFLW